MKKKERKERREEKKRGVKRRKEDDQGWLPASLKRSRRSRSSESEDEVGGGKGVSEGMEEGACCRRDSRAENRVLMRLGDVKTLAEGYESCPLDSDGFGPMLESGDLFFT